MSNQTRQPLRLRKPWPGLMKPSYQKIIPSEKEVDLELDMDIIYRDGTGKNVPAVYEGASTNGIKHTICL